MVNGSCFVFLPLKLNSSESAWKSWWIKQWNINSC